MTSANGIHAAPDPQSGSATAAPRAATSAPATAPAAAAAPMPPQHGAPQPGAQQPGAAAQVAQPHETVQQSEAVQQSPAAHAPSTPVGHPIEPSGPRTGDTPPGLPGPTVRMAMMAGLAAITVGLTLRPANADLGVTEPATPVEVTQPVAAVEPATSDVSDEPETLAATAPEPVAADSADDASADETSEEPTDSSEPAAAEPPATSEAPASSDSAAPDSSATGDSGIYADDFASDSGQWTSMTGTWAIADGLMVQSDPTGFDYINQLDVELPEQFDVTVQLRGRDGVLGGGVIVGQPTVGSRRGAYVVDFTNGGNFLRWGRYDPESGVYTYIGGLNVGASPDDWHELSVEVRSDTTLVYLDGAYLGDLEPIGPGAAGLITSESSVEFDDLRIDPIS